MNDSPATRDALVEAYLDGRLAGAELAAFERQLQSDASLRAEIELQGEIDASLGRLFAPPAPLAVDAGVRAPISIAARRGARRWVAPSLAAAAVLALAATVAVIFRSATPPPNQNLLAARSTLRQTYTDTVAAGFVPGEVCTTPEAFEQWVHQNYGHAIRPAVEDAGVQYVGWSYSGVISSYTGLLLARVDGQPVVVALDKKEWIKSPPIEGEGGQRIFERQIGEVVLYEITPLDQARVLPLLSGGE